MEYFLHDTNGKSDLVVSDYEENYKYGGINLYRSLFNHPILKPKKPFTKFEAWCWMLAEATWQPEGRTKFINFGGKEREVFTERGEFAHSIRFMQNAFGWGSKDKVVNFIKRLRNDFTLAQKQVQQITVLKIVNYGVYNTWGNNNKDSKKTAKRQQKDKLNKDNKDNNNIYRGFAHLAITINEHNKLIDSGYTKDQIDDIYDRIENFKDNKKYTSLYLTTKTWLRKVPKIKRGLVE